MTNQVSPCGLTRCDWFFWGLIRLFGYAAWHIQERKIHESQRHEIISNDEVMLTLETGDLLGVKLWLRRVAPDAEVVQPQWFRDEFLEDLRVALARYDD